MQYVFSFLFTVIPSILAAILYCKLGRRFGVARQWVLVSCLVLALMAMQPWWCVRIGADAAGHIRVVSALMIPFLSRGWSICCQLHVSQLIQLAVPLAIGWWFLRRQFAVGAGLNWRREEGFGSPARAVARDAVRNCGHSIHPVSKLR